MKYFPIFFFLLFGTGLFQARAEDSALYKLDDVSSIMEKAREDAKTMNLPANKHTEQGQRAAKQTADTFYSPEFQERIQCEKKRLEAEVFRDYIASWKTRKQKSKSKKTNHTGSLSGTEKIYLFLSSSVPDETVHAYLSAIAKVGDPNVVPVMRGFVRGLNNTKASAEYFSRILKENQDCRDEKEPEKICRRFQVSIKMNPLLFAKYGITRVPAVVYENEKNALVIQGDAGLDYLLERINRELKKKDTALANLVIKIRGEH